MIKSTLFGLAIATSAACAGRSETIASPDPNKPKATTAASSEEPSDTGPKDVATVCSDANAVARHAPDAARSPAHSAKGDAAIALLGFKPNDKHSLADLQALEKKEQYEELLSHIEDISPASRGASWDAMLARVATAYVATLANADDVSAAFGGFMRTEHLVGRYPQLRKSADFMGKRSDVGEKMFGKCFQLSYSGEECVGMALDFVKVAGTDARSKLAIAKIVSRNQNKYVAMPFFGAALTGSDHSACKDADFVATTTAALGLPPDYDNAKTARDIAENVCFAELEKPIIAELTGSDGGGYYKDNACAVLRKKGAVK
jgi:hypothetical protein